MTESAKTTNYGLPLDTHGHIALQQSYETAMVIVDSEMKRIENESGGGGGGETGPTFDVKTVAATTYTLLPDDSGKFLIFTSADPIAVSIEDDLPVGFNVKMQAPNGTNLITFDWDESLTATNTNATITPNPALVIQNQLRYKPVELFVVTENVLHFDFTIANAA